MHVRPRMHMYMYAYTRRYMHMRMHMYRYVYLYLCMCMDMFGRSWVVVKFVVLLGPQMTADWEPVFAKKTVIPPIAAKDQNPPRPQFQCWRRHACHRNGMRKKQSSL